LGTNVHLADTNDLNFDFDVRKTTNPPDEDEPHDH